MSAPQNPQNLQFISKALQQGFSQSQIAASLQLTPSAVHQYIEEHNLGDELKRNEAFKNVDENLNCIELSLTEKLAESLAFARLNPMQLGQLLKTVNGAKRRSMGNTIQDTVGQVLVQLNLPVHMQVAIGINSNNELIEVNGRSLTTMPSQQVLKDMEEMQNAVRIAKAKDSAFMLDGL